MFSFLGTEHSCQLLLWVVHSSCQVAVCVAALCQPEAVCSSPQTVATLSVLGTRRVVSILGVENQAVSLAACHLLQVMFDALREGVKKGFRGKEGAIIVGEWRPAWGCVEVSVTGDGSQASSFGTRLAVAHCSDFESKQPGCP